MLVHLGPTATSRATRAPRISTLASKLTSEPGNTPSEFRIFSAGNIQTKKGIFLFDKDAADSVMKHAREWGNDFSLDYDHGAFSFFAAPGAGMAAGWFTLAVRDGELWATEVEWTEKARAHLEAREYRYYSPTFRHEEGGRIVELLNVALTNVPATRSMQPLMASVVDEPPEVEDEETLPMWKTLLATLGLSENATEAEAIAAINKERAQTQTLLSATGKTALSEAVAVAQAWKVAADGYQALSTELKELKTTAAKTEMDAVITKGKADKKVTPAMEPHLRSMELSAAKAFIDALPVLVKSGAKEPTSKDVADVTGLSAAEIEVCAQTGISPEEFVKTKARRKGEVDTAALRNSEAATKPAGTDEDDDE